MSQIQYVHSRRHCLKGLNFAQRKLEEFKGVPRSIVMLMLPALGRQRSVSRCGFKASVVFKVSPRTARATQ